MKAFQTFEQIANAFPKDTPGYKWARRPDEFRGYAKRLSNAAGLQTEDQGKRPQVLDVGAGAGWLAPCVRSAGGAYLGVDIENGELVTACRVLNEADVVPFTLKPDHRPAGWWDVIVCGWITFGFGWSFDEWKEAILGLFGSLAAGGRLVLRFNEDRIETNREGWQIPLEVFDWLNVFASGHVFDTKTLNGKPTPCGYVLTK